MSATLPWFEPVADSPAPPEGVPGIVLAAPPVLALEERTVLRVSGVFQLADADAKALPREDAFDALTLLLVEARTARSVTLRPARSAVGLEPQAVAPGMRRGFFQADVFGQSGFQPRAGLYWVTAHLGHLRSNAVEVRVQARG